MALEPGYTFHHHYLKEQEWIPGPGQTYHEAPKVAMVVTRVSARIVHYCRADLQPRKDVWWMPRKPFEDQYCGKL